MAIESSQVALDTPAPDFSLPATDGQTYSLDSFADARVLVVAFTCNHCPYAQAAWPLLISLADQFKDRGVAFAAINPNDEITYPEDSFDQMKKRVPEWKINFPYLRDENQKVARAYKAACTPDVYVFDGNRRLCYHGRINDNWQDPQKVEKEELKVALEGVLAQSPPPAVQHPSLGCSIKWKNT